MLGVGGDSRMDGGVAMVNCLPVQGDSLRESEEITQSTLKRQSLATRIKPKVVSVQRCTGHCCGPSSLKYFLGKAGMAFVPD